MSSESEMLKLNIDVEKFMELSQVSRQDIDSLRQKLLTPGPFDVKIPELSDDQLCMFLNACHFNLDESWRCIQAYFNARNLAPELFNDRDLTRPDIQQQLKILDFCLFPKKSHDGYTISLHRLLSTSAWEYQMDVAMKVLFMCLDAILYEDLPKGLIMLFDMKGVGIMHLTRINFSALRKFFYYLQEALPIQLKEIHIFNCVPFLDRILKIVKPLMKQEIFDLVHFHSPDMNMEDFYTTYIPRDLLPIDYGGTIDKTVRELHNQMQNKLEKLQEFFIKEQQLRQNTL